MLQDMKVGIGVATLLCLHNQVADLVEDLDAVVLQSIFQWIVGVVSDHFIWSVDALELLNLVVDLGLVGELLEVSFEEFFYL